MVSVRSGLCKNLSPWKERKRKKEGMRKKRGEEEKGGGWDGRRGEERWDNLVEHCYVLRPYLLSNMWKAEHNSKLWTRWPRWWAINPSILTPLLPLLHPDTLFSGISSKMWEECHLRWYPFFKGKSINGNNENLSDIFFASSQPHLESQSCCIWDASLSTFLAK